MRRLFGKAEICWGQRSWQRLLVSGIILASAVTACRPETAPEAGAGRSSQAETTIAAQSDTEVTPQTAAAPTALSPDDPLLQDAAAFAESEGLTLEEALRRLEFQATIGDIQPALVAGLAEIYAGLWVEHHPQYRIVIALTEGDDATIQPYISGKAWAGYVQVQPATYTLSELTAAQQEADRIARQLNLAVTTAVDIKGNRIELMVGNPELFQADLDAAGLVLPEAAVVLPIAGDEPLPDTNQGVLLEVQAADDRTVYLPKQPPSAASMTALMEGQLIEENGCLRIAGQAGDASFLILWPFDSDLQLAGEGIEILNGSGEVIARVGQALRLAGGAMESTTAMAGFDEQILGLPLPACPGPYWVAGPLETLASQSVPDITVSPYASEGRMLALLIEQSRASQVEGTISGELIVDDQGCLRVGDYTILWPPGAYLRENPLRLFDAQGTLLAQLGDAAELDGAEKVAQDYRYFTNKVPCSGPYWGVGQ
jgi:hypothetical protein